MLGWSAKIAQSGGFLCRRDDAIFIRRVERRQTKEIARPHRAGPSRMRATHHGR